MIRILASLTVLVAPSAAQSYVLDTTKIPQGPPFNTHRTEEVDFGDVDDDGDLDVVLGNGGGEGNSVQNHLWVNLGGAQGGTLGFFEDRTSPQFPFVLDQSRDIELADIDGDGDLDVAVANVSTSFNQTDRFLVNQGGLQAGTVGFFVDDTQARWVDLNAPWCSIAAGQLLGTGGFIAHSGDLDFADLDADGDLDLVQVAHGHSMGGFMPTRLFLNDGTGHFGEFNPSGFKLPGQNIANGQPALWAEGLHQNDTLDATGAQADVATSAKGVELGDLDGDLDLDLLLGATNEPPRRFDNRSQETGALAFRDVTGAKFQAGYVGGAGHYEQELGDFDGDDDLDLYGVNWFGNFHDETLENVGGSLANKTLVADSAEFGNEADFGDYDNDGDLDVFVATFSGADRLYRNLLVENGTASYVYAAGELPTISKNSQDADFGDLDGDGDQDVITAVENYQANDLLENVTQVPDTHAPRAVNLEQAPDRVSSSAPTRVRVHVYDNASYYTTWYASVALEFRVGAGPWYAVPMRASGGQVFRGEVPGALIGALEYRVRATDAGGNVGLSVAKSFNAADGGCNGSVAFYCTSKTTSIPGCLPSLAVDGVPSASAPAGFTISVVDVPGGNLGLFLYTTNGAAANPVQTPFGSLCLQGGPGLYRIGAQPGGGTAGVCDGGFALDFDAYMAAQTLDPALVAGATVDLQCWYRDPPNPGGANFTSAVGFLVCP